MAKTSTVKNIGRGGLREGAGRNQLIPNKVRKSIDIPKDIAKLIENIPNDVSSYMREATYNQMVKDSLITREYADILINWKKK
jgi:hypothetical protein